MAKRSVANMSTGELETVVSDLLRRYGGSIEEHSYRDRYTVRWIREDDE